MMDQPTFPRLLSPLLLAGIALAAVAFATLTVLSPVIGLGLAAATVALGVSFRWPAIGLGLSLVTLVLGQLVRLPIFGAEGTVLPNDVLIPIVVIGWYARQIVDRRVGIRARPLGAIVAIFTGILALSWVVAAIGSRFTQRELFVAALYFIRWVEYLALFFLARDVIRRATLWLWLLGIGIIALALAGLGFLQLYFIPDFSTYVPQGWDPHLGRLLSTWFDPNFLAGFFVFIIVLFLSLATERRAGRRWSLFIAAVCLAALVLTFSRSGYLGFVVGFAVLAVLRARHFLTIGILALLLMFLFVPRVQERVIGIRTLDETAQLRLESWRNAVEVVRDHPVLGVGYNTYRYVQVDYGFVDNPALHAAGGSDSSLLTVAVTTGLAGLVAFFALLLRILQTAWDAARRTNDSTVRALGYGFVAGFLGLLVHGQFVNGFFYPHLLELVWVTLGFLLGVRDQEATA